jgi:hypothetical protein
LVNAPQSYAAHQRLRQAVADGRIVFYTDPRLLAKPGSPLYNPIAIYVTPVVLMGASLILLFWAGLIAWIVALCVILAYQLYAAPRLLRWRIHQRAVEALLKNPHNLQLLWTLGGLALALKDWPEQNCVSPKGDWIAFCDEFLVDQSEPEETPS